MKLSIIIPTLNEEENIGKLIPYFFSLPKQELLEEILIVDGGSTDKTCTIVEASKAILIKSPQKGRAVQMNLGAELANGSILFFVHADVFPPRSCFSDITRLLQQEPSFGCFTYQLDTNSLFLKMNAFFTRFDWAAIGGGDQTLFIRQRDFFDLGAFDAGLPIMEDFDFVWRAKKKLPLKIIKKNAKVSARRYKKHGYFKTQLVDTFTFLAFRFGYSPLKLAKWYRKMFS